MGFKDRMKGKRKNLRERRNSRMAKGGGSPKGRYPTIFLKDKIPEGVGMYQCKEGSHIVDIIPWEAGVDMPVDDSGTPVTEEGELDYVLSVHVHQKIGVMQKPYVCPYENFDLPCPICEYIKENRLPKDDWNRIRPKHRVVYLVWCHNDRDQEKKGIQIFEAAYYFMEQNIEEISKLPRGGGYEDFSDWENGKSLAWSRKGAGATDTQYIGHRFADREGPIPEKILDATFSLDQVVNMHPSYDEINEAFLGGLKSANPPEDDAPFKGAGDDTGQEEDWDAEPTKKKKKRKRPTERKYSESVSERPKKKKVRKRKRSED